MFRMQVNVNDEMLEKIDFYCKKLSVSRSSLSSMLIGQGLAGLDQAFGLLSDVQSEMKSKVIQQLTIDVKGDK